MHLCQHPRIFSAEGVSALYGAPVRKPVRYSGSGGGGDWGPQPRLVDCPDQDCGEPTVFGLPESHGVPPVIATDASGQTLVVAPDDGRDPLGVAREAVPLKPAGSLPEGSPVLSGASG